MRIYTRSGDLAFKTFTFPDGQPHFKLETYEVDFRDVTIETAIRNPAELLQVLLASEVLRRHGYASVSLDIRYLLGARMDRAIDTSQPFTLDVVARLINGAGFNKVRILDVHSEVALRLIRNSQNILPTNVFGQVVIQFWGKSTSIVVPDKGAVDRVEALMKGFGAHMVYCKKDRDVATGKLLNFTVPEKVQKNCLIVDDICDGGGTFVGLAKELRKAGAEKVYLFVTHGIFSKGTRLEGIDHIYTTTSYGIEHEQRVYNGDVTWIPISMKEL